MTLFLAYPDGKPADRIYSGLRCSACGWCLRADAGPECSLCHGLDVPVHRRRRIAIAGLSSSGGER